MAEYLWFFFFYGDSRKPLLDYAPAVYMFFKNLLLKHFESSQKVKLIDTLK